MAIKLKNMMYKLPMKILVLVIFFAVLSIMGNIIIISLFHGEAIFKQHFYETVDFQKNYIRLAHNTVEKYLDLIDEDHIRESETGEDVNTALSRYRTINENLSRAPSFKYVLVNSQEHRVITNISANDWAENYTSVVEYIQQFDTSVQWNYTGIYFPVKSNLDNQQSLYQRYYTNNGFYSSSASVADVVDRLEENEEWVVYTAVDFDLMDQDSLFGNDYFEFEKFKDESRNYIPYLIVSMVLLGILIVYFSIVTGKNKPLGKVQAFFYDYVPIEIQTILSIVAFIPLYWIFININLPVDEGNVRLVLAAVFDLGIGIAFLEYLSIVRHLKRRNFMRSTIIYQLLRLFKYMFLSEYVRPLTRIKWIGVFVLLAMADSGFILVAYRFRTSRPLFSIIGLVLLIVVNMWFFRLLLQVMDQLGQLVLATRKRAEGDMEFPIYESTYSPSLKSFATDLNALQSGLQKALEEAIKGEKLKTELITNVSHDLKTPLTSIVTYVDLLSKEVQTWELEQEENFDDHKEIVNQYLDVLNKKSQRLKLLIEDLVDASKASSGNLDVDLRTIDLIQLLQQCIGEKEDRFEDKKLELVFSGDYKNPIYIFADPNHMFRVFDNLFTNIVKYALEGTRVYVDINANMEEGRVCVELKNISNHPLVMDVEQITKRFVRGDISRSTEGSGLGLAIVESLLALQKGELCIKFDGDLFKAAIQLTLDVNDRRNKSLRSKDKEIEN